MTFPGNLYVLKQILHLPMQTLVFFPLELQLFCHVMRVTSIPNLKTRKVYFQ